MTLSSSVDLRTAERFLQQQGFEAGDLRSPRVITSRMMTPMMRAADLGELSVCIWLYERGAAEDVAKAEAKHRETCMMRAALNGHLSVCKWLLKVSGGAVAITTAVNNDGDTPVFMACMNGHLSVCKWLSEVGAAADITKENRNAYTPVRPTIYPTPEIHLS